MAKGKIGLVAVLPTLRKDELHIFKDSVSASDLQLSGTLNPTIRSARQRRLRLTLRNLTSFIEADALTLLDIKPTLLCTAACDPGMVNRLFTFDELSKAFPIPDSGLHVATSHLRQGVAEG